MAWCRRHPWFITAATALLVMGLTGLAFGLWQQTRVLAWRYAHPGATLPYRVSLLFPLLLLTSFILIPFVLVLCSRAPSRRLSARYRRNVVRFGAANVLFGMGLSLELIRRSVWQWDSDGGNGLSGASLAFVICWSGLILIWKHLGGKDALRVEVEVPALCSRRESNLIPLLLGVPLVAVLGFWIGGWLIGIPSFQGAPGHAALQAFHGDADMERGVASVFSFLATAVAVLVFMLLAARRSSRRGFWEVSPLAIGWALAHMLEMADWIPARLVVAALLVGLGEGWLLAKCATLSRRNEASAVPLVASESQGQ